MAIGAWYLGDTPLKDILTSSTYQRRLLTYNTTETQVCIAIISAPAHAQGEAEAPLQNK